MRSEIRCALLKTSILTTKSTYRSLSAQRLSECTVLGMTEDSMTLHGLYLLDMKQSRAKKTKVRVLRPVQTINHLILEFGGTNRRKVMLLL